MQWQWTIIIGSLVFGLVVVIGANLWALQDGSRGDRAQRQRIEEELRELLLSGSQEPRSGS